MSSQTDEALVHLPDAILANPRFPAARAGYVDAVLRAYNTPRLNQLLTEVGRSVTFFAILALYAAYDDADRATWPTPRLLWEETQVYGLSSERRVADIIARFVAAGLVQKRAIEADRRVRILVPTGKMVALDLNLLAAHFVPLEIMFPDPGYALPMSRDLYYHKAHRKLGRQMSAHTTRLPASNPPIMFFLGRDAGFMVLIELVQREYEGDTSRRVSFTDIGARFCISRTHVRGTLREADRMGLVRLSGRDVILLPPIVAAFDRFVADCMSAHDMMFRIVMREEWATTNS